MFFNPPAVDTDPVEVDGYRPRGLLDDQPTDVGDAPATIDLSGIDETIPQNPFDEPGRDLFDLTSDNPEYTPAEFDSVAAADEIEQDLDNLIDFKTASSETDFEESSTQGFDSFEPISFDSEAPASDADVIPLRPELDHPQTDELGSGAPLPQETGWVSLGDAPTEAPPAEDPWAYMRPSEEPKKQGFWSSLFGGDDRRRKRAQMRAQELSALESELGPYFDQDCPSCGSQCQVDFDDPVGRRVHASCPACKHVWATPYLDDQSQAG